MFQAGAGRLRRERRERGAGRIGKGALGPAAFPRGGAGKEWWPRISSREAPDVLQSAQNWVAGNLLYSIIIAGVIVILGAAWALKTKEGGFWGWLVLAGGVAFGFWALHLKGLW